MDEPTEQDILSCRLAEALTIIETLKNDLLLTQEVSQELARRNDTLQHELISCEKRMNSSRLTLLNLEVDISSLSCSAGSLFNQYLQL